MTPTVKTFLAPWKPAGGVIRVVIVPEEDHGIADFGTDPPATVQDLLEAVAGRPAIAETFRDVKELEGAGQPQLRYGRARVGASPGCLWGDTAVEWWAWDKASATICDRRASPGDQEERRPSHADKRKALQGERLERELWRRWGEGPGPPNLRAWIEAVRTLAAEGAQRAPAAGQAAAGTPRRSGKTWGGANDPRTRTLRVRGDDARGKVLEVLGKE